MLLELVKLTRFDTRAISSMLPTSRGNDNASSSRPMLYLSLIDEDEEMDYLEGRGRLQL